MDYVEPLTEEEQDAVHCYMSTLQNNRNFYDDISKKDEIIEDIEYIYKPGSFNYNRAKAHNRDPERIKQIAIDIYPKILKIAKELKLQHILYADFHEGNVGWDKDHENLIFYDLGGESDYPQHSKNKFKEISTSENFITRFNKFNL